MDSKILKSKRILIGMTQKELAQSIGISEKSYNHKEQNKIEFKLNEIIIIAKELKLSLIEVNKIFFDNNLPNV